MAEVFHVRWCTVNFVKAQYIGTKLTMLQQKGENIGHGNPTNPTIVKTGEGGDS